MRWSYPLAVLFLIAPAFGDIVHLKDGTKIEGKLQRVSGGWSLTDAAGKVTQVEDGNVDLIEKISSLSDAELAASKLTSLRRASETVTDPKQAIERYQKFIEQTKDAATLADARKDLALWQDRADKKLVKVGGSWMTPVEQAAALAKAAESVEQVRDLYKQGRFHDADAIVAQLLALDPNQPSALYLQGVLAFKQGQTVPARKSFERLKELLPNHGPSLNNLAVIFWQQHQSIPAVATYDLAMAAAPGNRRILDNVAEAFNGLTETEKNSPVAKRAAKRFAEQDSDLQRKLSKDGLYRWGATYINKEQMDAVNKAQEKIKDKLDALAEEYQKIQGQIQEIDGRIQVNNRAIERINTDRWVTDNSGRSMQLPPPSAYYEFKRQNDQLKLEANTLVDRLSGFADRERLIRQESPVPAYTGQQRIIEVEGTPLVLPSDAAPGSSPATAPATAPSVAG